MPNGRISCFYTETIADESAWFNWIQSNTNRASANDSIKNFKSVNLRFIEVVEKLSFLDFRLNEASKSNDPIKRICVGLASKPYKCSELFSWLDKICFDPLTQMTLTYFTARLRCRENRLTSKKLDEFSAILYCRLGRLPVYTESRDYESAGSNRRSWRDEHCEREPRMIWTWEESKYLKTTELIASMKVETAIRGFQPDYDYDALGRKLVSKLDTRALNILCTTRIKRIQLDSWIIG